MNFLPIDMKSWKRREYYEHYIHNVRCAYSLTVNIDITALKFHTKKLNLKIYPALIFMISYLVNQHKCFRMSTNKDGQLGYWGEMSPGYTVFNKEKECFSSVWTPYDASFIHFYQHCSDDIQTYSNATCLLPKRDAPPNLFNISALPWTNFTSFNLNIYGDGLYLLPIFTIGKFTEQASNILMPLAVQVHHAVCDGFHVGKLINSLQEMAFACDSWLLS